VIADVFTDRPLEGNPVAVFLESLDLPTELMQRIAREMNLSETVFLGPGDDQTDATLRIFTPAAELPFAGHPVLGSAFIVAGERRELTIRLRTGAGVVPVQFAASGSGEMRQPQPVPVEVPSAAAALRALGVEDPQLAPAAYCNGPTHAFVGLASPEAVSALRPDMTALADLGELGWSCFAALPPEEGTLAFRTRMFGPGLGVPEDPATGSAAGPLVLHLVRHGVVPLGARIRIRQGEEIGRPSLLLARTEGTTPDAAAVYVAGSAVIVARGEFAVPTAQ